MKDLVKADVALQMDQGGSTTMWVSAWRGDSNRLSVLVSGFAVGFGLVHTTFVSGGFGVFRDVSGSAVNGRGVGCGRIAALHDRSSGMLHQTC